ERVVAAAKFVGAHDFIQRLPAGYDTRLSERGGGLSAGQRQLISIARDMIRNPRLLVLDEATSALDGVAEQALLANIKRASRGRTVIMVTHRLGALAIADRVLFLSGGRVLRAGAPGEIANFVAGRLQTRPMPDFPPHVRPAPI
ncbi:MAG TPA: ATP-binding cassette domain-containing protein, partial [Geminicoccaceae bacterium]|nr:ATP-binding cassette domain-containing protein [Geminicoccaceae bacterium]